MKKCLLFIFLMTTYFFCNGRVILTHGALGVESNWYKPGGCFFNSIKESANLINESVESFSWEQLYGITHKERMLAGAKLAKHIIDLLSKGEEKIILVGHSYGGHVIKFASQLLAIAQGMQDINSPVIIEQYKKNKGVIDKALFKKTCKEIKKEFIAKQLKNDKKFLIDAVYTLGTPNDIPDYFANMRVIKYFYNFYSNGDLVQSFVGDKLLPAPVHKRALNVLVKIKGNSFFGLLAKPNHVEIRAQIIAKWILLIPFFFMENKIGNFDKFTFEYDAQINFTLNNPPFYFCNQIGFSEEGLFAKYDLNWLLTNNKLFKLCC